MYGSGAATSMGRIIMRAALPPIRKALQMGRSACFVAVAGPTVRGVARQRTASTPLRTAAVTAWASAWFLPNKQWLIPSILLSKAPNPNFPNEIVQEWAMITVIKWKKKLASKKLKFFSLSKIVYIYTWINECSDNNLWKHAFSLLMTDGRQII